MALPVPTPDNTVVITGASAGIGAELARQLATRNYNLVLVARRAARLTELAEELRLSHGIHADIEMCDLADAAARGELVARLLAGERHVAGVCNNAGLGTVTTLLKSDPERERQVVRLNVEAVHHLTGAFLRSMVDRGAGAILNVASTAAFQPMPGQAGYAASKAFVLSYSQAVRAELKGTGVSVTVLCPGPVDTEFAESAGFEGTEAEAALPRFMWLPAEAVATAAVDGLDRGRAVVIPGVANHLGALGGRFAPRSVLLPIIARQHPGLRR
jgi:short-subunit dehydrogenase